MNRDQKSFDRYSPVIGVLALLALGILVGGFFLSETTQVTSDEYSANRPQVEEAVPAEPGGTVLSGPQVYNEACLMCHGSGIGGAPTLTDKAAWASRIAQGNKALYQHAIEGYTGETGFMPPKGARLDLSDDEVKGAVDYMIDEVG